MSSMPVRFDGSKEEGECVHACLWRECEFDVVVPPLFVENERDCYSIIYYVYNTFYNDNYITNDIKIYYENIQSYSA